MEWMEDLIKWGVKWLARILPVIVLLYFAAGTDIGKSMAKTFMPDLALETAQWFTRHAKDVISDVNERLSTLTDDVKPKIEKISVQAKDSKEKAREELSKLGKRLAVKPDIESKAEVKQEPKARGEPNVGITIEYISDKLNNVLDANSKESKNMQIELKRLKLDMANLLRQQAYEADLLRRFLASEGYKQSETTDNLERIIANSVKRAKELEKNK